MKTTQALAAPRRLLLLVKSEGAFKHSGKYYLQNGRWHKLAHDKPAPKGAPVAAHPHAAGQHAPISHFTDEQWAKLKLPDSNSNAGTYNKQLDKLKEHSDSGNVTAILGSGIGTNTYGQKISKVANHLLGLHGSPHTVKPGQKAGEHDAVKVAPAETATPNEPAQPSLFDSADADPKTEKKELSLPSFIEGKTTTGVIAWYEDIASRVASMSDEGDVEGLMALKTEGLKPSSKGKVSNTWAGRTENSKMLLAFHDDAVAKASKSNPIDAGAHKAATSPHSNSSSPTDAQKKAGNYAKGHISVSGLDITVENPRGSVRTGSRPDGSEWSHEMADHYGYLKRTSGADAENIDVYVGKKTDSDKVFIVDQVRADGSFDEHKVMLGYGSKKQATSAYLSNFDKGWKLGPVTELSMDDFKSWLDNGHTASPIAHKDEPKEGDTKQGENGVMLALHDGRWHSISDVPLSVAEQIVASQSGKKLLSSHTEDWGNTKRGQGKRIGGMVVGAMSDAPRGKKTYVDILGKLKDSNQSEYAEASLLSTDIEKLAYAKAREAGFNHDQSLGYTWKNDINGDWRVSARKVTPEVNKKESAAAPKQLEQAEGQFNLESHDEMIAGVKSGDIGDKEILDALERYQSGKAGVIAYLSKLKKDKLLSRLSPSLRSRVSSENRDVIAKRVYLSMITDFAAGKSIEVDGVAIMSGNAEAAKFSAVKKLISTTADQSPKDGEINSEGLVFRGGRWHREDDGLSDDPNSPNYRYRDTGDIAGSRKELAAAQIKAAGRSGERLRRTDIDWSEIEKNPREARELIRKSNLFGKIDWQALKEMGMEPGAGFLIDRIYASVPQEPDRDSPQKRQDFTGALESLRDRLERCKTTDEVTNALGEIRDELDGVMLSARDSEAYKAAMDKYDELREVANEAKANDNLKYKVWAAAQHEANGYKLEIDNRERRKWKPDAALNERYAAAKEAEDSAHSQWMKFREEHPELETKKREYAGGSFNYLNDLEWNADQHRQKARDILDKAKAENLMNNSATRGWVSLGSRFWGVVNWRRGKGSDAFAGHVTNARRGKIDWSWAETEAPTTVKKATKKEVSFQLKVAEQHERKGGRVVDVNSTFDLKSTFNLRDVQSGNWVLSDPGSAAFHVKSCAEAFADLADIIGVSDGELSMNGRLAVAFGARGKGNAGFGGAARAHYEAVHRVINMTKMGGGGCLAHEWFHCIDNLVLDAEGVKTEAARTYSTEQPNLLPAGELRDAFADLQKAMHSGDTRTNVTIRYTDKDLRQANHNIDRYTSTPATIIKGAKDATEALIAIQDYFSGRYGDQSLTRKTQKNINLWRVMAVAYHDKNADGAEVNLNAGPKMSSFAAEATILDGGVTSKYWSSTREMAARAFQSYVEDKLESSGRKNDYLSSMADNKYYKDPIFGDSKPFPEGEERKAINKSFDRLMVAIAKGGVLAKAMAILA